MTERNIDPGQAIAPAGGNLHPFARRKGQAVAAERWTRRDFLALSGVSALVALVPPKTLLAATAPSSAPQPGPVPADAASLYRNAFVLDANTLASFGYTQFDKDAAGKLVAIRNSGLTAFKSTLGGDNGNFEDTVADIAAAQSLIDQHPELFIRVVRPGDLDRAKPEGRIAVILSFEAASMLGDKIERIELFRQLGILVMQLTYNRRTPFGCGCLDGDSDGVTELGRQAIAKMNELGVALDLSHANVQTTEDGIRLSQRPPVFTHAGCRAVFEHPRNKTDREMRALADKGGVMGIYMLPYLTADTRQPTLADYMRHMVHALDVCGEDHVGIGTDSMFFTVGADDLKQVAALELQRKKQGLGAPGENRPPYLPDINTPRKLEYVAGALLKHGYSARVTDKVLGLNFRRVFQDIWTV
jgi:membrane dipeptidase